MVDLKKLLYNFFKILVIFAGYYFVYQYLKPYSFDDFAEKFKSGNFYLIIFVFLLMLANWSLEAVKWKFLINKIEPVSFFKSLKAVLIGVAIGFFTPNRIGEILGRQIIVKNKKKSVILTSVGSLMQFTATLVFGIVGIIIFYKQIQTKMPQSFFWFVAFLGSAAVIFFLFRKKIVLFLKQKISVFSEIAFVDLLKVFGLSSIRYFVFILQYYLILIFFGIKLNFFTTFACVASVYLVLSFLPHIIVADIGIRGTASIFFFKNFTTDILAITIAPVFLWIINLLIPAVIGQVLLVFNKLQ